MSTINSNRRKIEIIVLAMALVITLLLLGAALLQLAHDATLNRMEAAQQRPVPRDPIPMPGPLPAGASPPRAIDMLAWIAPEDYPIRAIRDNEQGTVAIKVAVDASGRARDYVIVRSSGHDLLDRAACNAVLRNGRFQPARLADSTAIAASFSRRVTWRLPE